MKIYSFVSVLIGGILIQGTAGAMQQGSLPHIGTERGMVTRPIHAKVGYVCFAQCSKTSPAYHIPDYKFCAIPTHVETLEQGCNGEKCFLQLADYTPDITSIASDIVQSCGWPQAQHTWAGLENASEGHFRIGCHLVSADKWQQACAQPTPIIKEQELSVSRPVSPR